MHIIKSKNKFMFTTHKLLVKLFIFNFDKIYLFNNLVSKLLLYCFMILFEPVNGYSNYFVNLFFIYNNIVCLIDIQILNLNILYSTHLYNLDYQN